MKVKEAISDGVHRGWGIKCPACRSVHVLDTRWQFNGDINSPSFTPSLHVSHPAFEDIPAFVCHSVITNGVMHFCADCTHGMAGQSVPMLEMNPQWNETISHEDQ